MRRLDFGDTACVSLLHVKELTPDMAVLPVQSAQVSLANVSAFLLTDMYLIAVVRTFIYSTSPDVRRCLATSWSSPQVTPVNGTHWSEEAVGWFKQVVHNRKLYARIYPQGPRITVELFLEKGKFGAMRYLNTNVTAKKRLLITKMHRSVEPWPHGGFEEQRSSTDGLCRLQEGSVAVAETGPEWTRQAQHAEERRLE